MTDIQPEREELAQKLYHIMDDKNKWDALYDAADFILADRQAQRSRICGEILAAGPKDIPAYGLNHVGRRLNEVNADWRKAIEEVEHGTST